MCNCQCCVEGKLADDSNWKGISIGTKNRFQVQAVLVLQVSEAVCARSRFCRINIVFLLYNTITTLYTLYTLYTYSEIFCIVPRYWLDGCCSKQS